MARRFQLSRLQDHVPEMETSIIGQSGTLPRSRGIGFAFGTREKVDFEGFTVIRCDRECFNMSLDAELHLERQWRIRGLMIYCINTHFRTIEIYKMIFWS